MDKDEGQWDPFGFLPPPGAGAWTAVDEGKDLMNH